MWALIVVVQAVLTQDRFQVSLIHDQHPVETLPAATSDPSLRVRIRHRCHERGHDHPSTLRLDHRVCAGRELLVAVVNHAAQLDALVLQLPAQIPGLLGDPGLVGLFDAARRQDSASRQVHI